MSPELLIDITNPKYSEQSDIYALGMIIWEIASKCTMPFKDIDNNLVGLHIARNGKEIIPNDTPQDIHYIIERISLKKILEIIGDDESDLQTTNNDDKLLGVKKFLESQN
ncbi:44205_t:CDS:2, partial [Gigaspora margarita]